MIKPKIEVIPIDEAIEKGWFNAGLPGLNWAYRITPHKPENTIIGVMGGTKTTTMEKARKLAQKFTPTDKNHNPFSRAIKNTHTGKKEQTSFNIHPEG